MTHRADIDIDFGDKELPLTLISYISAIKEDGKKHASGIYIQPIPSNPITGNATISYKEADNRGYFKLDFLNVSIYNQIKNQEHYDNLMSKEPPWERLSEQDFVQQLIQISNYSNELKQCKPSSIPELAMFIAAIRPAKRHLLGKPWDEVKKTIWDMPQDGSYAFKKSHAISYAVLVTLHMNIIHYEK